MASWPICFDHVFRRLKGVVGSGKGGWYAFCPAHKDEKSQSLTVGITRKGDLMMRCHAGCRCPIANVLAALDLTFDDLFADNRYYHGERVSPRRQYSGRSTMTEPKKSRRASGKFVCAYPYHDEGERLLFEVVRFAEPKEFRQRRPNPDFDPAHPPSKENPQWVWNLSGVRKVPYRLPQLLADLRSRPHEPVALVEGEKDVDELRKFGVIATTVPGGAGKFSFVADHLRELLKGRRVAVVADDDPVDPECGYKPGLRHAYECCVGLAGHASTLKLVRLFDDGKKKDASDWVVNYLMRNEDSSVKMAFWKDISAYPAWDGEVPPGAEAPPVGEGETGRAADLFASSTVSEREAAAGDPFGERLAVETDRQRAKLHGPITDRDAIIGRLARMQQALSAAANDRSDEKFLSMLACIAAYARLGGEGISSV